MIVGPYTLRPHQIRTIERLRERIAHLTATKGRARIILQAPCGFGKTLVSTAIMGLMRDRDRQAMFITSGRQLIFQKSAKMSEAELPHSVLMANCGDGVDGYYGREYSKYNPDQWQSSFVISKDTYTKRLESEWISEVHADVAIVDEAHLAMSDAWKYILEPYKVVIGLTATPADGKGRGLGHFYDELLVGATYSELIEAGFLTPCKVLVPYTVEMKRSNGKKVSVGANGEYVQTQVSEIFNTDELVGDAVKTWKEFANDKPTMMFASSVDHSIALKDAFNAAGIPSEHVQAETSNSDRDEIYRRFRNGDIKVVTNYGVLRVGVDFPCAEVVQLMVSMNALTTYMQTVGRGLRTNEGKTECTLIDHGNNVIKHGWPVEDRVWPLDPDQVVERIDRKTGEQTSEPPKVSVCPKCKFEKGGVAKCPNPLCGYEYKRSGLMERTVDGVFREITPNEVKKKKAETSRQKIWMSCLGMAGARGMTFAAARGVFRSRTGTYPDDCGPQAKGYQFKMKVGEIWPGFDRRKK